MKKKNNMVELCRFLACYVIFSYHAGGRFTTGWIFVEFFFMLSGYFAIKHLVRMEGKIENKATYPIQYTIDKFKRLLPYTTVGFVADCLISAWKYQFTGMELVKWILYLPVNLFYLAGTGMMPADVPISDTVQTSYIMGGALWYICAMFVAMPVMMYLYLYLGKKIGPWLISFLPMLLYGYLIICDGTVNGWHADSSTFCLNGSDGTVINRLEQHYSHWQNCLCWHLCCALHAQVDFPRMACSLAALSFC